MPTYITTPIYYVNDKPHIGHCYTTLLGDIMARFARLQSGDPSSVFFLTGTDEHADKVVTSANAHGYTPIAWADLNANEFRKAFAFMGVTNNDFVRTTEDRHKTKVIEYITKLMKSDDIYKGQYTGWYDEGQEEYLTDTAAKEANYTSPINKKPLVKRTEPCYFFRLGKYQARLLELISTNPTFVGPDSRRQEVLGRLKPPAILNDIPVSRPVTDDPATQWGIRIPGDDANRIYVWIDALFNYLSYVDTPERRKFWPATVHLIGKDILWFHAVIWPALLMALGEPLPRTIFGHGWWISEGQKMSKSLGNFIDIDRLKAYADKFGLDALRWYLATQGPLSGSDSDFSHVKFVETFNTNLANGIGNCASRVGNMIDKYFDGVLPPPPPSLSFSFPSATPAPGSFPANPLDLVPPMEIIFDWPADAAQAVRDAATALDSCELGDALLQGIALVTRVDGFINTTQPFKLAKLVETDPTAKARLASILYCCAEAIRIASLFLAPAMPSKMAQLWDTWSCAPKHGVPLAELAIFAGPHGLKAGQKITKGEVLFMRADPLEPLAPADAPAV